ncbi:MAG: TonB-dependent receptor [Deltaproteobacteria bacterium]|nr:TonB-dependent receptor [Deltaproteobacteria bacterium]
MMSVRTFNWPLIGQKLGLFVLILGALILILTMAAEAQETSSDGSVTLEKISVTSTRVTRDLSEIPLSVSVIGQTQIEEKPLPETLDYLRDVPGVQVGQNTMGSPTFSIRGSGSARTLVLVDGVKQKIATAYFESEAGEINVDPSEIERIEVIKGPASALYGSDAIGGVINVITKKGGDKPVGFNVGLKYDGSNESLVPRASIFGTYAGFYYRVSGSGFTSRDKVLPDRERLRHSDAHRENYDAKFGYQWDNGSFDFSASRFSAWYNQPGTRSPVGDVRKPVPPSIVGNNYSKVPEEKREMYLGKLTLNNLSQYLNSLTATIYYLKQAREQDSKTIQFNNAGLPTGRLWLSAGKDEGETIGGAIQADFRFGDHYLTLGIDADRANAEHFAVTGDLWSGSHYREGNTQTFALFAQDEWRLSPFVTLTYGLRYTVIENNLTKNSTIANSLASTKEKNLVGSLGLVYHGTEGLSLRALISQGFRAPTLSQQLIGGTGRFIPNRDLEPETSLNFEMGARYSSSSYVLDLALFYSHLKEAFYSQSSGIVHPAGGYYIQWQNSDQATSYGAEIMMEYTFGDLGLTPYLSMTAMRYVRTFKNGYKSDNSGVPRTWGVGGLRWERDISENLRLYTNASLTWSGGFHDEGATGITSSTIFYDSGLRADFIIGLEGGDEHKYKAALNFRNIGDERYEPDGLFQPGFHVVGTLGYEF